MNRIYDHEKLCLHKKMVIPQNIRLGEMMTELLNGVSPKLLKNAIISLKKEYLEEHDDTLNTKEKKDHVQMVLDKIATGKYNFAKQNIEEGEKFNLFYEEVQIPIPAQEKTFQCEYCKVKFFKTNASLHSHLRACPKKIEAEENSMEGQIERTEGFRPVRRRDAKQGIKKLKKVPIEIIKLEQEEKGEKEFKDFQECKPKRDKPVSTFSFGSDIFYGDE